MPGQPEGAKNDASVSPAGSHILSPFLQPFFYKHLYTGLNSSCPQASFSPQWHHRWRTPTGVFLAECVVHSYAVKEKPLCFIT